MLSIAEFLVHAKPLVSCKSDVGQPINVIEAWSWCDHSDGLVNWLVLAWMVCDALSASLLLAFWLAADQELLHVGSSVPHKLSIDCGVRPHFLLPR